VKPFERWGFGFHGGDAVNRILKPITYVIAAVYLLADVVFMPVARRIGDWIANRVPLRRLSIWIRSLRPYPSLALFSVPVIILEPVKPAAAYLAATGQIAKSVGVLIVAELLKLVLVERLFCLTRDKLMRIPAFAWAYTKFCQARSWLKSTEAWQAMRRIKATAREFIARAKLSGHVRLSPMLKAENNGRLHSAAVRDR
jgi:hypothetical protein